jgi:hypothetical protein
MRVPDGGAAVGDRPLRAVARDERGVVGEAHHHALGQHALDRVGRLRARLFIDDVENLRERAAERLGDAGFATEETNPEWIYKARRDSVTVDLIFWLKGDIYLDDAMVERARAGECEGVSVSVIPPEDLIVVKAAIHDEQTPRHWFDALGIVAEQELDWDYLAQRARHAARRVLALLVYAQSNDLVVTDEAIRTLFEGVYGPPGGG